MSKDREDPEASDNDADLRIFTEALDDFFEGVRDLRSAVPAESDVDASMFALAERTGMDVADLDGAEISADIIRMVPQTFAETYRVCPIGFEDGVLTVALATPLNPTVLDDLRFMLNLEIRGAVSNPGEIDRAIERYYLADAKKKRKKTASAKAHSQEVRSVAEIEALAKRKLAELEAVAKSKLAEIRAERRALADERAQLAEDRLLAPAYLIMSALDRELRPEQSAALEDQLASTDALAREEWAWMQRVSEALGSLRLGDPPPETWAHLAEFVSKLPD